MIKKNILLLMALACSLSMAAQSAVGDWRIHTSFVGSQVTSVAETSNWVYYLAGEHLFRLDKETQENEALSKVNLLSAMTISQVFYNSDKDYLVVIYSDTNIDLILSDGAVVNMPEIENAVMTSSKKINDVTFAPGLIYVATDFGYVVIDDSKFVVKESHVYNQALTSVAQVGNLLLLSTAKKFYYGMAGDYHEQLSTFTESSHEAGCRIRPINDDRFFAISSTTSRTAMTKHDDGHVSFSTEQLIDSAATVVQKTQGGFLLNVPDKKKYYKSDVNGENLVAFNTGGEICSAHPDGDGTPWACGPLGLHQYGSESYYLPNALNESMPFWMAYNVEDDLLYVSTPATNAFFKNSYPTVINTYDGMTWKDATPPGAPIDGSYWIDFVPGAPNTYLMSTWRDGLIKVVDDEIAYVYNTENSPMRKRYALHPITSIDRNGNVWVVQPYENEATPVMVLPAAKVKSSQVAPGDWLTPTIDGIYSGQYTKRASFISTRNGNQDIKVFTDGDYQTPIFIWNSAGDISSRPQQVSFSRLADQDGESVSWTYVMCLAEDLNGTVWMGTTEGICAMNPANAFSANFNVVRPKVPRNDGTGMADRLMDGIQVNSIAVDGANRKWIATQSSGLFLVNSDGTEIIKKFNTANSPLASNTIYRVCCNPNSNSVYLTTPAGLYEYFSDSSPAEKNYDNIYAYPNPVRPEYTGEVTLVGMMDNTLVKIADAGGNVVRQLKSTGGMATWDCCNQWGEHVKTGVYLVICSRANGGGEAVVTKIAVIR